MNDRPAGALPFKAHRAAYNELMQSLFRAQEQWHHEGDGGLLGAKNACRSIIKFINVRGENPELAAPFIGILRAFEDLERDVQPELFSKSVNTKQRSRSSQHKWYQLVATVLLDVLIVFGDRQNTAAAKVAKDVSKWTGMSKVTGRTVINWRDRPKTKAEQRDFDAMRTHIFNLPPDQVRFEVERLLRDPPGMAKT